MPGEDAAQTVVLDACVLVGTIRRHVLLSLAEAGLYHPIWSPGILDETERAIPKALSRSDIPIADQVGHASGVRHLMSRAFPNASVRPDENIVPQLALPDPDDAHVVAIALRAGASVIVTENLRDFPKKLLAQHDIIPLNADHFAARLYDHSPESCRAAMTRLVQRINRPDVDRAAFLARMRQTGFRKFSAKLAAM